MSFLEQLRLKKETLKNTKTVITQIDGRSFIEDSNMRKLGCVQELVNAPKMYGFVVDTSPDKVPSEVIPGLYIGSQDCVEPDILKSFSISHVVSVGVCPDLSGVDRIYVPCLDLPEEDVLVLLEKSKVYIKNVLNENKSVLVHCNAGVSRASTVVIGFLMIEKNYSFQKAYDLVKSKRQCIQPNRGFIKQLKSIFNN